MRRRATVELSAVLAALAADARGDDELVDRVLDGAERLLRSSGLRRWSVDDVAEVAGVGRTSVYRRFPSRDDVVHAVLARELRATLRAVAEAAAAADDLEGRAVAAAGAAFAALDGSVVESLLRSDPATFLPFLTTEAGPLVAIAREAISAQVEAAVGVAPPPELAEAAARCGLSFVLTRDSVLPVDDPVALEASIRAVVRPFLAAFGAFSRQ